MRFLLLPFLAVAIVFPVISCGSGEEATSISAGTAEDTPSEISPDPSEVLTAISAAMSEARTWQVQAQLTVEDDSAGAEQSLVTTINGARSGPGENIVLTYSDATTGSISGSTSSENRIVDGKRYRRDPNTGEWTVTGESDPPAGLTIDAAAVDRIDRATAAVAVEELDGAQVYHVTGTITGETAAEVVEIYAGIDDHLVRMIRLEGTALPANFGGLLAITDTPLPQRVEAHYLEHGRPIAVHAPPAADPLPDTEVQTYLSTINPYTMEVSTDLKASPRTELGGDAFSGGGGEALFIIEEYLDVEAAFVGELQDREPNVESYARRFEIELENSDVYEIVSNEPFTTDSGLKARLIEFTEMDGDIKWLHLSYLHGEDFGFGASYGGFTARFDEIKDDILASFRSFDIVD